MFLHLVRHLPYIFFRRVQYGFVLVKSVIDIVRILGRIKADMA